MKLSPLGGHFEGAKKCFATAGGSAVRQGLAAVPTVNRACDVITQVLQVCVPVMWGSVIFQRLQFVWSAILIAKMYECGRCWMCNRNTCILGMLDIVGVFIDGLSLR